MKDSIISKKNKKSWYTAAATIVWLLVWQGASLLIDQKLILPSPFDVIRTVASLGATASFWSSVAFSLTRVAIGFLLAFSLGILFAVLAYNLRWVETLLYPLISVIKAAPVASYIILCLLLMPTRRIPIFISFLMGFPIMYQNTLQGLNATDHQLLEMAFVFKVPRWKKIVFIYLSELMPFIVSAASLSLGLCWKAGIAAEVISIPLGSIGEQFNQAKVFADTTTVLAWTIVVIFISFVFEKLFLALLTAVQRKVERI